MNFLELSKALKVGETDNKFLHIILNKFNNSQKWNEIREAADYQEFIREIYQAADCYSREPLTELPYSLFKLYWSTGSRKEYEEIYFNRRGRLCTFAILSLLEKENNDYISSLEDILWAICNEFTWALPAHLEEGGISLAPEKGLIQGAENLSYSRNFSRNIDLFAAETAFALAEISYLLGSSLSGQVVSRVQEEIYFRVLKPYLELNNVFHWELLSMNWAAVCAGSIGAAAIYLIEDSDILTRIISRVLDTMDVFISGFTDDGACQEGLLYWNYGFGFYTYFAELLKERTDGQINLMDNQKIEKIALFQQNSYINGSTVISFSDTPRQVKFHAGLSSHLNELYTDFQLTDIKYRAGYNDDNCYRWPHIIRDLVWFRPLSFKKKRENRTEVKFYEDVQLLIYRQEEEKGNLFFAAKGGSNDEPHNHNDIGNFIFHLNGTSFLTDLGSGEYTKDYFNENRYKIFCNGSQGHSVPILDGKKQHSGRDFFSTMTSYQVSRNNIEYSLEIGGAYSYKNIRSLVRVFQVNRLNKSLTLRDEYNFNKSPASIIERFITLVEPDFIGEGKLLLKNKSNKLIVLFNHKKLKYSCSREYHMNHSGTGETVYLLNFYSSNIRKKDIIEFRFVPFTDTTLCINCI